MTMRQFIAFIYRIPSDLWASSAKYDVWHFNTIVDSVRYLWYYWDFFYCDKQYIVTFLQVTAINKRYRRWGMTRTTFPQLHSKKGPCWHLNHMDTVVPSGLISVMMYHQYKRQGLWRKCRQLKQSSIQYISIQFVAGRRQKLQVRKAGAGHNQ